MLIPSVDTYQSGYHLGRCQHWVSTLGVDTHLKEGLGWEPVERPLEVLLLVILLDPLFYLRQDLTDATAHTCLVLTVYITSVNKQKELCQTK